MEDRKRVALITGASQGLGACMARRLAELGFRVIVNYAHSTGRAENVAAGIRESGGDERGYETLIVTPKEVDVYVRDAAGVIAAAVEKLKA